MFLPNTSAIPHTTSSSGTSVSTPHDTCIPISHGLNSAHLPQIASRPVNFERFTAGRLSYIPGIVKLYESPGRAGGLLRRIYPVAHGDNHVEVVKFHPAPVIVATFSLNYLELLGSCRFFQFAFLIDVSNMEADDILKSLSNRSAICFWESHNVSCTSQTSSFMVPPGSLNRTMHPRHNYLVVPKDVGLLSESRTCVP